MGSPLLLAALKVLVLAGGGEAAENYNSHAVHVRALVEAAEARGIPKADIAVFWADGAAPGADRAVVRPEDAVRDDWLLHGTRLDEATRVGPALEDTTFPGYEPRPAKRRALKAWLAREGGRLQPGDTLLLAVTDHGQPDPKGEWDTRISLWGESWTTQELAADLRPVPEGVRVVLWMSQCYGGGFAGLHLERENLCGSFAAMPDRPAYGCFPELAERQDIGHFQKFLAGLQRHGTVAAATDEAMLTDDTPDTPHLTSDAFLYRTLAEEAERRGQTVAALVDARLAQVPADAPARRLAQRIARQYGLGDVSTFAATEQVRRRVDAALFALDEWSDRWDAVIGADRARLAEPFTVQLARAAPRDARVNARRGIVKQLKASLVEHPALDARLAAVNARVRRGDELSERLELQEAAALRIAYLYARLAAPPLLSAPARDQLEQLRACEEAPLLPPVTLAGAAPRPKDEPPAMEPLPPVDTLVAGVAELRPAYLGVTYDEGPAGAKVKDVRADGPGGAAGLRAGDVLVKFDDAPLNATGELRAHVALAGAGHTARITVLRDGGTEVVPVRLVPMPLPLRPLEPGDAVPALELGALEGAPPLPKLSEDRPTVLFFWATHCGPCKRALPALKRWAISHNAQVVAITNEPAADVAAFHAKFRLGGRPFPFPIALDLADQAHQLFAVRSTPAFVHVDGSGRLIDSGVGFDGRIPLDAPPR